jgi:hypothetical protein
MLSDGCGKAVRDDRISADHTEAGFLQIFNGRDLVGWEGDKRFWSVQDGAITGQTTKDNPLKRSTYLIWRGGTVADFELRLSYRIESGNSGIQFRSRELDNWIVAGYQADLEAGATWTGALYEVHGRAALVERGQKVIIDESGKKQVTSLGDPMELLKYVKPGGWNDYHIIAYGNDITLKINGVVMSQVIDEEKAKAARSGIIAIQLHSGPPMKVQLKDIRLKRLPSRQYNDLGTNGAAINLAWRKGYGQQGCLFPASLTCHKIPDFYNVQLQLKTGTADRW